MADEHVTDAALPADAAETRLPRTSGPVDKVKDVAHGASTKLDAVTGTGGEALAPVADAAGIVASAVSRAARDSAQTVVDTITAATSPARSEDAASGPPDHSGSVPETGDAVATGTVQNLPGQGFAGRETM